MGRDWKLQNHKHFPCAPSRIPLITIVGSFDKWLFTLSFSWRFSFLMCQYASNWPTNNRWWNWTRDLSFFLLYQHGLDVPPNCANPRIPQMVWASTAYTIKTLEETQRNSKRALLASLSNRLLASLVALVNFAAYLPVCLEFYEVSGFL